MGLDVNSLAAAVGSSVKNVQFVTGAVVVPRKILILATYDPTKTAVVPDVPVRILSAASAGDQFGFGFMAHRLALQAERGARGIETWVSPQAEPTGVQAAGSIAFTASDVKSGTIYLYIANSLVKAVAVAGDLAADIAQAVTDAINADRNLPVTAVRDGDSVDLTSKSNGTWGNFISIAFNLKGETLPTGVGASVTDMASGAGVPDLADALDGLGVGDAANEKFFTDVVHGYGLDTDVLDAISDYVGEGNEATGLYDKLVHRPFRALTGDVVPEDAGLTALIAISDARKLDRANGVISVPGSESHPSEIAAQAIGHMARLNNNRAEEHFIDVVLEDINPGDSAVRWTGDYDNRDLAVKSGISPTRIKNGVVVLQNVVTFYRPDDVAVASNGYRSMRNIAILQNILYNIASNFDREKWKGISIVSDVTAVTSTTDREKARDVGAVIDDLVSLAESFESLAWIYSAEYTIAQLKVAGAVVVRAGGVGFDSTLKVVLSGEGGIFDTVTEFDTSIAVTI